jgi:cobalt/nickel transport system permease protein
MGIVPGFVAYAVYQLGRRRAGNVRLLFVGVSAWLSVVVAALVVSLLLAFSGTSSLGLVLPAMLGVHVLIGIGEALITVAALAFVRSARPALLEEGAGAGRGGWVAGGLAVALILVLLAPFASGHPDGLEWVAAQTGFLGMARAAPYTILPDYTIPFLGESGLSTIAAGIVGVLLVAGLVTLAARTLRRREMI